jgi:hypothetical protein
VTALTPGAARADAAVAHAEAAIAKLSGTGVEERAGRATALATLALATETRALRNAQEVANLMTWLTMPPLDPTPENVATATTIAKRLGL